MQVTTVIATYNASAFITRALDSAWTQAGLEHELVVVDDGSTDDTVGTIERGSAGRPNVRLVALARNGGPAAARNAGIAAATGDWVAVLDADDAFLPGRLSDLVAAGEQSGADIVADNFFFFDIHQPMPEHPALRADPAEQWLDLDSYLAGARPYGPDADFGLLKPLFRRSFLREHGLRYPDAIRHGEDFDLSFHCLLHGARYRLVRRPYYLYTVRTSGFSRTRVDYRAQIARSRQLAAGDALRDRPRSRGLLKARCSALKRLMFEREFDRLSAVGDRADLLRFVLSRPPYWHHLARRTRRYLSAAISAKRRSIAEIMFIR